MNLKISMIRIHEFENHHDSDPQLHRYSLDEPEDSWETSCQLPVGSELLADQRQYGSSYLLRPRASGLQR